MGRRRKGSGIGVAGIIAIGAVAAIAAAVEWIGRHPEVLLLALAGAGGALAIHNRSAKNRADADVRSLRAMQEANARRILDDCLSLCRNSAKASTRTSRAALGIRQVEELQRLGSLDEADTSRLLRYFHAVARSAQALEAFAKGIGDGTTRTRWKRLAEARALAREAGLTDEILRDAEALHPATAAPLVVADVLHDDAIDRTPHDDEDVTLAPSAPAIERSRVALTSSVGAPSVIRRPTSAANARWVQPGETVEIAERRITAGMLWIGTGLAAVNTHGHEPALIDPSLPVDESAADVSGDGMPYSPSYAGIDPQCRAAYLAWLANGRCSSEFDVGYVFLFYYGLERRLLHEDRAEVVGTDEVAAIREEIERLLTLYPRGSFPSYAQGLLNYIDARWNVVTPTGTVPSRPNGAEIPVRIRAALGQAALEGKPIPSDLALAWLRSHPAPGLGRSFIVCAPEFDALFQRRYTDHFGSGLIIKPNRARIVARYGPASASFGGREARAQLALPDPTQVSAPWTQLHSIASGCCDDLDPFRRLVSRRPDARNAPEAFISLPTDLHHAAPSALAPLRSWAGSTSAAAQFATAEAAILIRLWCEAGGQAERSRPMSVAVAQLLDRWDIGIEPDTRFGGPPLAADGSVVLFRNPRPRSDASSDGYAAVAVVSQLCAVFAMADGHLHPDEARAVEDHLAAAPDLDDSERRRLVAHFHWSLAKPPSMTTLGRRLRELPPDAREGIRVLLIRLVSSDARVHPADVKLLARVYKALDMDPGRVHADIHAAMAGDGTVHDGPHVVRPAGTERRFQIPPEPSPQRGIVLDQARVDQRVAESVRVAQMLGAIFADDPAPPTVAPPEAGIAGLDPTHSALLRKLRGTASLSRAAFEALATDAALLPDGAIETLNEAAFEIADAPLCEGDDPIDLDAHVLEVMLR
ncbi:MAG: TerB N-terminal domain-containing protein [bacterium]|nr:TerB N-terminal domain-containing protein [bacterium]